MTEPFWKTCKNTVFHQHVIDGLEASHHHCMACRLRKRDQKTWTTRHEQKFLDNLGGWMERKGVKREDLLRSYLKGIRLRVNWGGIDKSVIFARVLGELGDDLVFENPLEKKISDIEYPKIKYE